MAGAPLPPKQLALAVGAGLAGAAIGHYAFLWIIDQGLYAMALPGALAGLGAGVFVRGRSNLVGGISAAIALAAGVVTEWRHAPFIADRGFGFFLLHLQDLRPITWIMMLAGAALGFWLGRGR